jgi:hypothetical protein
MQILGLSGMYFDDVVVEFRAFLLLFKLALAILWKLVLCTCIRVFILNLTKRQNHNHMKLIIGIFFFQVIS